MLLIKGYYKFGTENRLIGKWKGAKASIKFENQQKYLAYIFLAMWGLSPLYKQK